MSEMQTVKKYLEYVNSGEYQKHERIREGLPHILNFTQETALDLYQRGFNVFPLPSVNEWRGRPNNKGNLDKHPFGRTGKLFYTRLHYCGADCSHLRRGDDFLSLFQVSKHGAPNIGVMAGVTSGNLLIIDCDTKESFEHVLREHTERKIPFWAFTGHRGGTILVRVIEGEVKTLYKTKRKEEDGILREVELLGRSHYAVIPPSIHPMGTHYTWYTPEPRSSLLEGATLPPVSIKSLEWLGAKLHKSRCDRELLNVPSALQVLSLNNQMIWVNGCKDGERNLRTYDVACDMAGNGITQECALEYMREFAERCYPPLSDGELRDRVKSAYSRERNPARYFRGENLSQLQNRIKLGSWDAAQNFAGSFDFRTLPGNPNKSRRVFLACIERARMDGAFLWRASIRELAELAFVDKSTASDCTRRFIAAGLLERPDSSNGERPYDNGGASLYRFGGIVFQSAQIPYTKQTVTTTVRNSVKEKLPNTDVQKDVFGVMRGCAWEVYCHLLENPEPTIARIAKTVKHPYTSVSEAVKQLIAAGLASLAEGFYTGIPVTDAKMTEITVIGRDRRSKANIHGRAQRRREQHRHDRELDANRDMHRSIKKYRRNYSQ